MEEKEEARGRRRGNWHKEGKINRINAYPPGHEFGLEPPPPPMDARNFVHTGNAQVAEYVRVRARLHSGTREYVDTRVHVTRTQDYRVELRVRSRYLRIP